MPDGYLVQLGDTSLDPNDSIVDPLTTFTTDTVIGAGDWIWSGTWNGQTFTNTSEPGVYYLATNDNVYFVPDFGPVDTITSASVETAPSFSTNDGIVSGTTGDDTIDDTYTDSDGDVIDGGDGTGPAGNEDLVEAGAGNDSVASGLENDTVYGEAGLDTLEGGAGDDLLSGGSGNDSMLGGDGNDTLYGDDAPQQGQWDYQIFDYNFDSSNFQAFDIESGTLVGDGQTDGFDSTTLVNDARGTTGDPNDFGVIYSSQLLASEDGTYTFSTTSDDGSTIQIFDENGTALTWTNQGGGTAEFMDNDRHQAPTSRSGEVTLEAGRLYTIEVRHWENAGGEVISGTVTSPSGTTENLADSALVIGPESNAAGDDVIDGEAGDDQIFGNDGNDTLTGGTGADTLYGGLGDDEMYLAEGDVAFGGDGDDLFVLGNLNETGSSTITLTGGEGGETTGDTLQLNAEVTQDDITFTNTDDAAGGLSGTFTMTDGTVVNFDEIENIICFTPGTRILTERGERAIETLRAGDRVLTRDRGLQPIRWIGRSTVEGQGKFAPIALNSNVLDGARRPLLVSPQHRMLFTGYKAELLFGDPEVLIAAKHLVDGRDVRVAPRKRVTYFHLMLDRHEVIFAEGAATESFHANDLGVAAISQDARDDMFQAFPHLRADLSAYGDTARQCLKAHEARLLCAPAPAMAA
ncbi:MAG TPA: Hint domain-containing protein [Roseovarius sp.]|nr:Hint domain-containing protein [Roseovarius sp.]